MMRPGFIPGIAVVRAGPRHRVHACDSSAFGRASGMSRAFVNEDHEPPRRTGRYELPEADAPDFQMRVARLMLEAARVSEIADFELATGLTWGDPTFRAAVTTIRDAAEREGDDRLAIVAERYLRVRA